MPQRSGGAPLLRLVRATDFGRVLAKRGCASSEHFTVHHLAAPREALPDRGPSPSTETLSTTALTTCSQPVDDLSPAACIGAAVPKRHARRAVTRTLLKRAIYASFERQRQHLGGGWWVVRLRAPFDGKVFISAASAALKQASRGELDAVLAAALAGRPR